MVVIQQAVDGVDQITRPSSPNNLDTGYTDSNILTGNQLRQDLRRWLSPPDPSTNHNIASNAHHEGTATWFFQGTIYHDWKSTTSEPLLWVYGKRAPLSHSSLTRALLTRSYMCSWLRQDNSLVCVPDSLSLKSD
jgi:hypothetical protein